MRTISLRSTQLPIEHLNAELLAAPLASPVAFGESLVSLDPVLENAQRLRRPPQPLPTHALWRQTEAHLAATFPGTSIDELLLRRDAIWFGQSGQASSRELHTFLSEATAHLLDSSSAYVLSSRASRSESDLRNEWKWVRFALPADLLFAAMGRDRIPAILVSPTLGRRLADKGFAETHLHLKAAIDFPMLWESLQSVLYHSAEEDMFVGPGADFEEGTFFAPWLIRVAIARLLLAGFLTNRQSFANFEAYQASVTARSSQYSIATASSLITIINELAAGQLSGLVSFASARQAYALMTRGYWRTGKPNDPMSDTFGRSGDLGYEFTFIEEANKYMRTSSDSLFGKLFWQCQRVRVRFYRHVVQRPMTPGLQFFTRTYARLSKPRKAIRTIDFASSAIRLSGQGLASLEARVVPDVTVFDNLQVVRDFDSADFNSCECALVFHFSKSRGRDYEAGCPHSWGASSNENPAKNASGFKFANFYRDCRRQATALSALIRSRPEVLLRVRGVDYCTDELGIPTWVLKPAFEHFHSSARKAAQYLAETGTSVIGARSTVHVGEDFVHLLGGLRRIGEAVEFLQLADGDRLGHALALGIDSREWVNAVPIVPITMGERLFDLIWARHAIIKKGTASLNSYLPRIENELLEHARYVFAVAVQLHELDDLYEQLHQSKALQSVGFPDESVSLANLPAALSLLSDWLCNQAIFNRSTQIHCVSTLEEAPFLSELQDLLRSEVAAKGIVIEVNPTSNLLVGNINDITNHPLWRMSSPDPNKSNNLRICIGSDDPITFATNLPEEYQLLIDSITRAGYSSQDADRWIEEVREAGMASRFTIPVPRVVSFNAVSPPLPSPPMIP